MSRPFPDTFDDRSPQTPLSGGPPTNISYQANVNRQKTKKWVEAKPVSYGGDDWGDEYDDEYSSAPPPPSMPKATGYRQPGQGASGFNPPGPGMPTFVETKKSYGELPRIPNEAPERSATNPQLFRKNSFQNDDERRAFSSGPSHIAQAQGINLPPLRTATPPSVTGLRKPIPLAETSTPTIEAPGAFPDSRGPTPMAEYQQQPYYRNEQPHPRALSPQVGAPYGRNASPGSPLARSTPPPTTAPRKSSLSQGSDTSSSAYQRPAETYNDLNAKPWPGPPAPSHPTITAQNPAPPVSAPAPAPAPASAPVTKALPFIRPADIYKRLEEERMRARQSQETDRPDVNTLMQQPQQAQPAVNQPPVNAPTTYAEDQDDRGMRPTASDNAYDYGRQQPTMLEPVQERRSEYSIHDMAAKSPEAAYRLQQEVQRAESPPAQFQPYRPSPDSEVPPEIIPESSQQNQKSSDSQNAQASVAEEARRFSVSPKLPDFNRLSGFGFDMWSKPEETGTTVSGSQPQANDEPAKPLQREPSLGFTSMVHQAFDRNASFSEADSKSEDVRRTDSTSTGTEGISPIISRGHAGSIGDRLTAEREGSTPAIAEEVEPQVKRPATPDKQVPFHLGHRRDINLPSGQNSPARTPVVASTAQSYPVAEAHVAQNAETTPESDNVNNTASTSADEERPRPPIPGGWQSYATTATAETEPGFQTPQAEQQRQLVSDDAQPEKERTLFSPPVQMATVPSIVEDTSENPPSPDPALAPIGNPYAMAPLDSRLDDSQYRGVTPPASKSQETITSLQPPVINEPGVSPGESIGPTPPPKDTPKIGSSKEDDYFPPPVPLKVRTAGEKASEERLAPPTRPEMLPTLSTNTSPYDDENDRLRKEIVKSLSPRQSLSAQGGQGEIPDDNLLSAGGNGAPRESMYLPSEYDNYWAATEDEKDARPIDKLDGPSSTAPQPLAIATDFDEQSIKTPPIPAMSPKRASIKRASIASIPAQLEERYSWEMGHEQNVGKGREAPSAVPLPESRPWSPEAAQRGSEPGKLPVGSPRRADSASPAPLSIRSAKQASEKPPQEDDNKGIIGGVAAAGAAIMTAAAATAADVLPLNSSKSEKPNDSPKAIPALDGVVVDEDSRINDKSLSAEVSPITSANNATQQIPAVINAVPPPSQQYPPAPLMKDTSPYEVSPLNSRPTSHISGMPSTPSHGTRPTDVPKPRQFREIMNMPTPEMRIQAYEEARRQYASADSGLVNWLNAMKGQELDLPPPAPPRFGQFGGQQGSHSRSDSFAAGQPSQQHQHTGSISSPFGNLQSRQSGGPGLMGFGAQGSKTQQATQQAKEKSKELLHSAGIFGGKASKAGKGLLAKGKSRWLGGHGDKETATPQESQSETLRDPSTVRPIPAKRRSSWLPHLHSHSSSGRSVSMTATPSNQQVPDVSNPSLHDNFNAIPHPSSARVSLSNDEQQHKFLASQGQGQFFQQRQRADSLPLNMAPGVTVTAREVPSVTESSVSAASSPARPAPPQLELNLPQSSLRDDTWGNPSPSVPSKDESLKSSRNSLAVEEAEKADVVGNLPDTEGDGDGVRPPKPIGKYQPSWDPFNATPIAEEEFGWDKNSPPAADRQLFRAGDAHQPGPSPPAVDESRPLFVPANVHQPGSAPSPSSALGSLGLQTEQDQGRRDSEEWVVVSPVSTHAHISDEPPQHPHPPFAPLPKTTSPRPDTADTEHTERGHSRGISEVSALTTGTGEIVEASTMLISKPPMQARISYDNKSKRSSSEQSVAGKGKEVARVEDNDPTPQATPFDHVPGAFPVTPAAQPQAREYMAGPGPAVVAARRSDEDPLPERLVELNHYCAPSRESFVNDKREPLHPALRETEDQNQVARTNLQRLRDDDGTRRMIAPSQEPFEHDKREVGDLRWPVRADISNEQRGPVIGDPRMSTLSTESSQGQSAFENPRASPLPESQRLGVSQAEQIPARFAPAASRENFDHEKRQPSAPNSGRFIPWPPAQSAPSSSQPRQQERKPSLSHERTDSIESASAAAGFSLPPIRRTSTFGIGIVPKARAPKERFAIDDGDTDNERDRDVGQSDSQVVSPMSDDSRYFTKPAEGGEPGTQGHGRARSYSLQEDQPLSVTRDSFSRPPIVQQGSSEYGSLKTADATPTPMGMYPPRSEYVTETPPVVPPIDTSGRSYVDIQPQQQMQQSEPDQQPSQTQKQPGSQASSIRRRSEVRHPSQQFQRRISAEQQRGAPFTAPVGQPDRRVSQPVGPYSAAASSSQRPSYDAQRSHQSMDSQRRVPPNIAQPPKITPQYTENRPVSIQRVVSVGIPPSSAERYPELFQSSQPPDDDGAPSKSEVPEYPVVGKGHLPRQQATEYQIPGVGPPEDDPRNSRNGKRDSRRNSGFFKEIGGRLSRASSRERRSSMASPLDDNAYETRERDIVSRDTMSMDSDDISLASGDKPPAKKEKRQSMLGVFHSRASSSHGDTVSRTPPISRGESMVTHRPASRADLLAMKTPKSPVDPNAPQPVQQEKKRRFFGKREDSGNSETGSISKLSRQSTGDRLSMLQSSSTQPETAKKKGRFSLGLGNILPFGKKSEEKSAQFLPLSFAGVWIKVKNDQERTDLENMGLLHRDAVRAPQQPQAQQQQQSQPLPGPQPQFQPPAQQYPQWVPSAFAGVLLKANNQQERDFFQRDNLLRREAPRGDWNNLPAQIQSRPSDSAETAPRQSTSERPGLALGAAPSRDGPPQPIAALAPANQQLKAEEPRTEKQETKTAGAPPAAAGRQAQQSNDDAGDEEEEAFDVDLMGSQQSVIRSATFDSTNSGLSKESASKAINLSPVPERTPNDAAEPVAKSSDLDEKPQEAKLPFPLGGGLFDKPKLKAPDPSALYGAAAPSRDVPDPFAETRAAPALKVAEKSGIQVPLGLAQVAAGKPVAADVPQPNDPGAVAEDLKSAKPVFVQHGSTRSSEPESRQREQNDVSYESGDRVKLPESNTALTNPSSHAGHINPAAMQTEVDSSRGQASSPPAQQRRPPTDQWQSRSYVQSMGAEDSHEPQIWQRSQPDTVSREREVYIPTGSLATQVTPMHILQQQNTQTPLDAAGRATSPGGGPIQVRSPAFAIPPPRGQTVSPRSPLGAPPITQPLPPVLQSPVSQGSHQQYAARLAQAPPQLQKRPSSEAGRHVLQKRPSSAARDEKAAQQAAEPKKRGLFSSLLGGKRSSALGGKKGEKAPPVQQQQTQQQVGQFSFAQQPTIPQFDQQQRGQQQFQNRSMPGQPQQQFAVQQIPVQYYAPRGGNYPPPQQGYGGMGQPQQFVPPQHQSMPAFRNQQEYDDYMRHQQEMQMQMQRQSFGQPPLGYPHAQQPQPAPLSQQSSMPRYGSTPVEDPRLHLEPRPDSRRSRALSSEDLVARSPAKQQFGQQAPYQLSLPGGDDDGEDEYDSPHAHRQPKGNPLRKDTLHQPTGSQGSGSESPYRQAGQHTQQPQQHPGNVPLPDTLFSPINEAARDMPPPPPPKFSGQPASSIPYQSNRMLTPPQATRGLDRSNTVMSDVSSLTIPSMHQESLSVPSTSPPVNSTSPVHPNASAGDSGVSSASTPQMQVQPQLMRPAVNAAQVGRSEPVLQRVHIPSDIRSPPPQVQHQPVIPLAMPEPRISPPVRQVQAVHPPPAGPSAQGERTNGNGVPDHEGLIYDNSREEKIVVEDATVRRVNNGGRREEDEAPIMSATSFPGDMWTPGGWEEWRD